MLVVVAVKMVLQAVIMPVVQLQRMMNVVFVVVMIVAVLTVLVYLMVTAGKVTVAV